jgi:GntP family gluconate:H+ symporter
VVLVLAFVAGIPAAAVGGVVFSRWIVSRVPVAAPAIATSGNSGAPRPGAAATAFVVALPIGLMLLATVGDLAFPPGDRIRTTLAFVGHPVTALSIGVFVALWIFGRACRFTRPQMLGFADQSVSAIGVTLLVVGGGGGFARVLREAGVANALGTLADTLHLPPLIYGWLLAAFVRVATGSATVAITTAAGLLVPMLATRSEINRELLVIALGFGSLFLSHLNDGGFWIVKDCLGLTVGQTLRTWTVVETIIGVVGLGVVLLLSLFL